jgi:hypothetical protein
MIEQPPQASEVGIASGLIEIGRGKWNAHDYACLRWKSVKPAGGISKSCTVQHQTASRRIIRRRKRTGAQEGPDRSHLITKTNGPGLDGLR